MIATFIGCFRLNSYYLRVVNAVEGPLSTRATLPRKSQLKAKSLTELRTWRRPSPSCLMRANTRHRHEAVACCMRLSDKAPRGSAQSRLRKSAQYDKWSFCLTAGKIGPRIRRDNEQASTPEPHTGFQGEGGACGHQRRDESELAQLFDIHPSQITTWKAQLQEGAADVLGSGNGAVHPIVDVKSLHAKAARYVRERFFLKERSAKPVC